MKKMKKIFSSFLLLLLFLISFYSCSSSSYVKLKIEMPFTASVPMNEFDEIIVTNFLLLNDVGDFDLNQELIQYLSSEIGVEVNTEVKTTSAAIEDETSFENEEFWQSLDLSSQKALLLSCPRNQQDPPLFPLLSLEWSTDRSYEAYPQN